MVLQIGSVSKLEKEWNVLAAKLWLHCMDSNRLNKTRNYLLVRMWLDCNTFPSDIFMLHSHNISLVTFASIGNILDHDV